MFAGQGGRDLPVPVQRPFPNDTLINNWQEDRQYEGDDVPYDTMMLKSHAREAEEGLDVLVGMANCGYPLAKSCRLQRYTQNQPHSSRTIPVDFPNREEPRKLDYVTTKDVAESHIGERLKPAPQPCMLTQRTMGTVYMDRSTKVKLPFGSKHPAETTPKTNYTTTNKEFYEQKVEADRTVKPSSYFTHPTTNGLGGILDRDVLDHSSTAIGGGRAGARGPISRHPEASGAVAGPSVFVDEYAEESTRTMRETARLRAANLADQS